MDISLKRAAAIGLGIALLGSIAGTHADEWKSAKSYELDDGTVHATPGDMLQYLRSRDNGLAAGNPKDIVNAYPTEFDNVGDLIQQKRQAE